ncbi:DedA family protein [Fictibacillus sp. b24]|uniref:DedA family protein n=1 Tax=Fictibacillus sp. b24 TaxID=3055863 RepID=UPI0025A1E29B|nr:DedA family protein [Fictibacillus sp. b24]MDM5315267.1 DedA family protein [Fictibacillus sp. b24]
MVEGVKKEVGDVMEFDLINIIHQYSYFGIFLLLALGIIGLPIPDEILLATVGYFIFAGDLAAVPAILSAFFGAITGITGSYYIGTSCGKPLLKKLGPKIGISEDKINKTQNFFLKYGKAALFFGYFMPGVRHLTAYFAGMYSLSLRQFALFAYSGAIFWCSFFILIGYQLAGRWALVMDVIHKIGLYAFTIVILSVVAWIIFKPKNKSSYSNEGFK